jgi:hypothetical protein
LAEGEHTIAFVSSFPFRFAAQSTVSWSFPSNSFALSFFAVLFELQGCHYRSSFGFSHYHPYLPMEHS